MKEKRSFKAFLKDKLVTIIAVFTATVVSILLFVNWTGVGITKETDTANVDTTDPETKKIETNADLENYFDSVYSDDKEAMIYFMWGPPATEKSVEVVKDCGFTTFFTSGYSKRCESLCTVYGLDYIPLIGEINPIDLSEDLSPGNIAECISGIQYKDEPIYNDIIHLDSLSENHARHYPNKLFFANLLSRFPDGVQEYMNGHTYEEYVDQYCNVVFKHITRNRFISTDYYPLEDKPRQDWLNTFEVFADRAKKFDAIFNVYVLSTQHFNFRQPSEETLRYEINVGLAYGATSFSYFTYCISNAQWSTSLTTPDGETPYPLYYMAQKVNRELRSWDHVITNFKWQKNQLVNGALNKGLNPNFATCIYDVENLDGIENISADRDTIFGQFSGLQRERGYMVTNFEDPKLERKDKVDITFENKDITKAIVYKNGERSVVDVVEGAIRIELDPSEMAFVIPYDLNELNATIGEAEEEPIGDPEEEKNGVYTVKFNSYCATAVEDQKVNKDSSVAAPETPVRKGYNFLGWYNNFEEYDFDAPVEKSMILDAHWKPRSDTPYSVKIYVEKNGEFVDETGKYQQHFGTMEGTTDEPTNIRDGAMETLAHLGNGYCFDENIKGSLIEDVVKPDGSTEFAVYYPKLVRPSYYSYIIGYGGSFNNQVGRSVVTYRTYGSETYSLMYSASGGDVTLIFDEKILDLIPEGTENISLYVYQDCGNSFYTRMITGSPWAQAKLGNIANGKWSEVRLTIDEFKQIVSASDRNHWLSFAYWSPCDYYFSGLYADGVPFEPSKNETLTVSFDSNGGSEVASQQIANGDCAISPAVPERWGFAFDGWYYDFEKFDFRRAVRNDIELKALWKPIEGSQYNCEYTINVFAEEDGNIIDKSAECKSALGTLSAHVDYEIDISDKLSTILSALGDEYYVDRSMQGTVLKARIKRDGSTTFVVYVKKFEMPANTPYTFTVTGDFANNPTKGKITGAIAYGEEQYSYKIVSSGDPKLIFNKNTLDSIPEGAKKVCFYVYQKSGTSSHWRIVQDSPFAQEQKGDVGNATWSKIELSVEEFRTLVDSEDRNHHLSLMFWIPNTEFYFSELYFE